MNKKINVLLCTMLLLFSLVGCGKNENTEVTQAQEYYENELGMDADEARELAEDLFGDEDTTNLISSSETTDNEDEIEESETILVNPSQEIVNSSFIDPIMQVGNAIIHFDEDYTLEEFMDLLNADSGFSNLIYSGSGSKNSYKENIITADGVLEAGAQKTCTVWLDDKALMHVTCWNNTSEAISLLDAIIVGFDLESESQTNVFNELHFNCYYPGNINAGYYSMSNPDEYPEYEQLKDSVNVLKASDFDLPALAAELRNDGFLVDLDDNRISWIDVNHVMGMRVDYNWREEEVYIPLYRSYELTVFVNPNNGELMRIKYRVTMEEEKSFTHYFQ